MAGGESAFSVEGFLDITLHGCQTIARDNIANGCYACDEVALLLGWEFRGFWTFAFFFTCCIVCSSPKKF
jgi:hypothetical protein